MRSQQKVKLTTVAMQESWASSAFSGSGNRLAGKKKGEEPSPSPVKPGDIKRGIPNYEFKLGKIAFIRNSCPLFKKVEEDEAGGRFVAFSGERQSLRKKRRKP
ncbi:Hypothetical predicted protein [Marmota monax]|uniref:Uncharacterized protein n=1 Tax=Marmota monax TaxID=9995 RepID=A0A5E4D698_MARMO|nr:hypothetical protein GHT09_018018 [Marmota monax]VTJ88681.1 Hypothetical predicted protein [Marmota monax]